MFLNFKGAICNLQDLMHFSNFQHQLRDTLMVYIVAQPTSSGADENWISSGKKLISNIKCGRLNGGIMLGTILGNLWRLR